MQDAEETRERKSVLLENASISKGERGPQRLGMEESSYPARNLSKILSAPMPKGLLPDRP
jgi:hypothetical protein